MNTRIAAAAVAALLALCQGASAQRTAVSTDLSGWAYLVTPNVEIQRAVSRRWSIDAGARANAWSFRTGGDFETRRDGEVKARQQTYFAGARFWPWNFCSGWWAGLKAMYSEYDNGGLGSLPWVPDNEAGNALGAGVWGGYALQLSRHWDLDMGLGVWGGWKRYTVYACPWCGKTVEKGEKAFLLPSDAMISVLYVF